MIPNGSPSERLGMRRQKAVEQQHRIYRRTVGDSLGQVGKPDQHEENEGHCGKQRVEGQRAGQEWDVVFVSRLERPSQEACRRTIPPAGPQPVQASGSSRSADARRRALASARRRSSSSRGEEPPWLLP